MKELVYDVAVIGAGPAGLAAAVAARKTGAERVVIVERDEQPGGILQQCIHPGFGLKYFNKELTGPEYAQLFIGQTREYGVDILLGTMAIEFYPGGLKCSSSSGIIRIKSKATVLAMGCRERTRGNLAIPGSRPAGIYTAGTAQRLLNIQGLMVGRSVVILGSGDIGMIMARRLTLEGAKVKAVVEILPYLAGLIRNKVQCLDDFGIPLLMSHTITDITGLDRVESVTVSPVDENGKPILSENSLVECDTLLLSVGLIPENELTKTKDISFSSITKGPIVNQFMQTEVSNIFACGNVLHVNDLVDNVSREGELAGKSAAIYAIEMLPQGKSIHVIPGKNVRYVCPQRLVPVNVEDVELFFRVSRPMTQLELIAEADGKKLVGKKAIAVSPGEMQSLTIEKEVMGTLLSDIIVSVVEGEKVI